MGYRFWPMNLPCRQTGRHATINFLFMNYETIKKADPEIYNIIKKEEERQKEGLELIPSENYVSEAILEAMGSILTDKYAEGYPKKRYYGGNQFIDEVEALCQKRALEAYGLDPKEWAVNVQPLSGSPANIAVYFALMNFGDKLLSLQLTEGGHLTHGAEANFSGRAYKPVFYPLNPETQMLDYDSVKKLAHEHKPQIVLAGYTAYPRTIDFIKFAQIAKEVGAYSMADISHISGLIAAGVHPSPFPDMDVVTTTTHKLLRGPRAAVIFSKRSTMKDGKSISDLIDKAIFPGLQGGPHEHTIAGVAIAFKETMTDEFKKYAAQVITNAKALAASLMENGIKLVSGGTDNHLLLIDLTPFGPGKGIFVQEALEQASITANKNTIPNEPASPFFPSGLRLGTPSITTRGFKEGDMKNVGKWISEIIKAVSNYEYYNDKAKRQQEIQKFRMELPTNEVIKRVKKEVNDFCSKFPVPGID